MYRGRGGYERTNIRNNSTGRDNLNFRENNFNFNNRENNNNYNRESNAPLLRDNRDTTRAPSYRGGRNEDRFSTSSFTTNSFNPSLPPLPKPNFEIKNDRNTSRVGERYENRDSNGRERDTIRENRSENRNENRNENSRDRARDYERADTSNVINGDAKEIICNNTARAAALIATGSTSKNSNTFDICVKAAEYAYNTFNPNVTSTPMFKAIDSYQHQNIDHNNRLCLASAQKMQCFNLSKKEESVEMFNCTYYHPQFDRILQPRHVLGQQNVCIDHIWGRPCVASKNGKPCHRYHWSKNEDLVYRACGIAPFAPFIMPYSKPSKANMYNSDHQKMLSNYYDVLGKDITAAFSKIFEHHEIFDMSVFSLLTVEEKNKLNRHLTEFVPETSYQPEKVFESSNLMQDTVEMILDMSFSTAFAAIEFLSLMSNATVFHSALEFQLGYESEIPANFELPKFKDGTLRDVEEFSKKNPDWNWELAKSKFIHAVFLYCRAHHRTRPLEDPKDYASHPTLQKKLEILVFSENTETKDWNEEALVLLDCIPWNRMNAVAYETQRITQDYHMRDKPSNIVKSLMKVLSSSEEEIKNMQPSTAEIHILPTDAPSNNRRDTMEFEDGQTNVE